MESTAALATCVSVACPLCYGGISSSPAQCSPATTAVTAAPSHWRHLPSRVPSHSSRRRLQIRGVAGDPLTEDRLSAEEFFESFLQDRQASSDFVSKASDVLWKREVFEVDEEKQSHVREKLAELQKIREERGDPGFLKLSQTRSWSLGVDMAPVNSKPTAYDTERLREDRRRASFLEYEALKRELSLVTAAIATASSIYCLVVLSFEASLSYGVGALGSMLYLQLLFRYADEICEDNIAEVFLRRRPKKIGIRGSDIQDSIEKTFQGSSLALSSPRLVIPASLFGLWAVLHQSIESHFSLQLAPLMLGFFAYKAAALVQAYRDNKDLVMTFPEEERESESR